MNDGQDAARRDYRTTHPTPKAAAKGQKTVHTDEGDAGCKCTVCGLARIPLAMRHTCHFPTDVMSKNYPPLRRHACRIDLHPLACDSLGQFRALCSGCHSTIGRFYEFHADARARTLGTVRAMVATWRCNPTEHADLVNV